MTLLRHPQLWLVLCTLALSIGCQRVHVGDEDGGVGEQCGPITCDPGLVCCNESCGVCTAPGEGCTAIGCTESCASNAECGASDYCALTSCGGTGTCLPRPGDCATIFSPVCGCDGMTYGNSCGAASAGMSVDHDGECSPDPRCAPQDARGDGDCPGISGVAWNGQRCDYVGGCGCVGADCGSLFTDILTCERAMSGCASCGPQDARGEGPCDAEIGTSWNGTACVSNSGCSCVGADCGALRSESGACEAAHRHCVPRPGCSTNADCTPEELCLHPRGECSSVGTCELLSGFTPPSLCPDPGPPVCGCDGVTYGCDDHANQNGVSVAHDGECGGACAADDAEAEGPCALFLGFVWDGSMCVGLSGCSCVGADCGSLVLEPEVCEAAHLGCGMMTGGECGGFAGLTCRPDEWCDFEDGASCGATDGLGRCQPRPEACSFEITPVCGCDGRLHDNECFANMSGYDIGPDVGVCGPVPG